MLDHPANGNEECCHRAVNALKADGLFNGQNSYFFEFLTDLAEDADAAQRQI